MVIYVGDSFQKGTKYFRDRLGSKPGWLKKPEPYKEYLGAMKVQLPPPDATAAKTASLAECLRKRASVREFSGVPLNKATLSFLLWASGGIRKKTKERSGFESRTAPSAGALYPIETYVVANLVDEVESGIYHYSVSEHSLELLRQGNFGQEVSFAALEQGMCQDAAVVFIWTAIFERTRWKYGQRAYRYVYLDAGHIAQNLALAATGIGLGSCQIGALFDDEVNAIIGVDGKDESVIYMSAVGVPS
jgi:SagB-type dehydrogenase family enzyme